MDSKILRRLWKLGIPTFSMDAGLTTKDFGWGSPTFHKMGRHKINLIGQFTHMGFDILLTDVDTVWMRDPLPFMERYPDADILASSDRLATTAQGEELERWPEGVGGNANIGIMLFRATEGSKALAAEWSQLLEKDDKIWDQDAFNQLFRRGAKKITNGELFVRLGHGCASERNLLCGAYAGEDNLFLAYDGRAMMGILGVSTFLSGHTFFVQRMHQKQNVDPYVVHATFQFSGTEGKRHRFREAGLWHVDSDDYYDPPGGFLTYVPDIPSLPPGEMKWASKDKTQALRAVTAYHFDLVNPQLKQFRNAMAVAMALGRTLVMPPFVCGYDRWWAPHYGRIPGSYPDLPFVCPMDHVLDLPGLLRTSDDHFGKATAFSPHVKASLASSWQRVKVCGDDACSKDDHALTVKARMTDTQLADALSTVKGAKVIEFTGDMAHAFGGFESEAVSKAFERRLKASMTLWCCIHDHPGHIWYDIFYDIIPHTDRHNREWNRAWFAKTGP
eukprot:scaffold104_cov375-Prasinococcus_capsulatus_cf.AAC.16